MAFQFQPLKIPEIILIQTQAWRDNRGFFMETYKATEFSRHGIEAVFVQDNYAFSTHGVLRGLHYQNPPHAQGKLIMALRGEIFDVAVDIRKGSPTYGQWVGQILSEKNLSMLYVPIGFAHGYCVLSDEACVWYKVTDDYAPTCERGILWNDPTIDIQWPIPEPVLLKKDLILPRLQEADNPFVFE